MNKLYQNYVIGTYDKNSVTNGITVKPCEIVSAKIVSKAFRGYINALHIDLARYDDKSTQSFDYGLFGENVFHEFMKDLNVDINHPEGLVGKIVEVHVPQDTTGIRGISLQK